MEITLTLNIDEVDVLKALCLIGMKGQEGATSVALEFMQFDSSQAILNNLILKINGAESTGTRFKGSLGASCNNLS